MTWDDFERSIAPAFDEVGRIVRIRMPTILGGRPVRYPASHYEPFAYVMTFLWDTHRDHEDLIVAARCHPADVGLHGRSSGAYVPHQAQYYLLLEIERGTGEELRTIGPEWLASGVDDPAVRQVVHAFADRIANELDKAVPLILRELETAR